MIKNIFFTICAVLICFVIWFTYNVGFFQSVEIREEQMGPLSLAYKDHVGPYHQIIDAISAVEAWAKEKKIPCKKTFGEYLDDPQIVEHERLRSLGGCVIETPPSDLASGLPADIHLKEIPQKNYVVGLFRGAPMIGPFKVYPKMEEYFHNHQLQKGTSIIEIYEMANEKDLLTKYLFEIVGKK
ncbi:MAG: GyrI-like domain-containing protein [Bdellovibrionota bacterium]